MRQVWSSGRTECSPLNVKRGNYRDLRMLQCVRDILSLDGGRQREENSPLESDTRNIWGWVNVGNPALDHLEETRRILWLLSPSLP